MEQFVGSNYPVFISKHIQESSTETSDYKDGVLHGWCLTSPMVAFYSSRIQVRPHLVSYLVSFGRLMQRMTMLWLWGVTRYYTQYNWKWHHSIAWLQLLPCFPRWSGILVENRYFGLQRKMLANLFALFFPQPRKISGLSDGVNKLCKTSSVNC